MKHYNPLKPLTNSLRAPLRSTCCLTRPEFWIWESGRNSSFFAFEKLRGFKPSQFGPFCAKCMCSSSLLPQRSLRCESQRLEVSGPGGARCLRRPVEEGWKREEGWGPFPVSSCYFQQKPQDFLHKVENVLENVINIRVLFFVLSPLVFSHFAVYFFSPPASLRPFRE